MNIGRGEQRKQWGSERRGGPRPPRVGLALALLAGGLLAGCQGGGTGGQPGAAGAATDGGLPPTRLNLPPAPKIVKPAIPQVHPDGVLSVYGLFQGAAGLREKEVRVRGVVVDLYVCPWAAEEEKERLATEQAHKLGRPAPAARTEHPPCKEPYFFVADSPRARQKLLVVGYDPQKVKQPEQGQAVTLSGTFANESREGFLSPEGLLVLTSWLPDAPADGGAAPVPAPPR